MGLLETINPNDCNHARGANVNVIFLPTLGLRDDSGQDYLSSLLVFPEHRLYGLLHMVRKYFSDGRHRSC